MKMNKKNEICAYCLIKTDQPQKFGMVMIGKKESPLYTIHYEDTAMVVSHVSGPISPNRENVTAHQKVLTDIMKKTCIIPMGFGTVFRTEEDVKVILKYLYDQCQLLFPKLENKIEVGLKLIAKKEWLDLEVEKDPNLMKWKKKMQGKPTQGSYYDQINAGEEAKRFMEVLQKQLKREIYEPLHRLTEAGQINDPISERMLLNAAFLIDKSQESTFDQKVNELYQQWHEKLDFKYSGPWPPYNFINIRLKIEGKQ